MKDFLRALLRGFLFIVTIAIMAYFGIGIMLLIGTFTPEPILVICGTVFVVWFVGKFIE